MNYAVELTWKGETPDGFRNRYVFATKLEAMCFCIRHMMDDYELFAFTQSNTEDAVDARATDQGYLITLDRE